MNLDLRALLILVAAALATLGATASTASAEAKLFSNDTTIEIPDHGLASVYPSAIDVQGMPGVVTDIYVTLHGVTHENPYDLDILLESPDGDAAVVMSDSCGSDTVSNRTWSFHMGSSELPTASCPGVYYGPANHFGVGDDLWPYGPFRYFEPDFDRFIGQHPNGQWKLWVVDDAPAEKGKIAGGWSMTVASQQPAASLTGDDNHGPANPYPLTKTVSGRDGVISNLEVTLSGIYFNHPDELSALLVGPRGQKLMLMSGACGMGRLKNHALHFSDTAPLELSPTFCPADEKVLPTDLRGGSLPSPAPPGPYTSILDDFDATDPDGEWRLYLADVFPGGYDGFLTGGFDLDIQTRAAAPVSFTNAQLRLREGESGELRFARGVEDLTALGEATVNVTTRPVSAGAKDFAPIATTLTLPRGKATFAVPIDTLADDLPEGVETFEVVLSDPTGDARLGEGPTAVVTIEDDDPPKRDDPRPDPGPGPGPGPVTGSGGDAPRGQGDGDAADRTPPIVSGLKVERGRARFTLSEGAALTVTVTRGRRTVRTLRLSGRAGRNVVQLGKRRLKRPGRYRVRVVAVDAAGNRSAARTRRLKVGR